MVMGMRSTNSYVLANKYDVSLYYPHERTETVIKVLAEYISDEDLKPGAKLPPEKEFRKIFGVGARVLREALICLKGIGLVQSRPGKGWYVESFNPAVSMGFIFPILKSYNGLDMDQIMQIRLTNEPLTARLAARNISDYGLTALDLSLGLMEEAGADGDLQKFQHQDKRFHAVLAQECGNAFLPILGSLLMGFYYLLQENPAGHYTVKITQHQEILQAIKARDSDRAEKAMAAHIQKSWDYLNARKKEWVSR
jgi:GntR family transcriptional regulator, transcriptional repressor for pyruvate dehydrogenase complex